MNTGLLERVLTRRYGRPTLSIRDGMAARCWNTDQPENESVLYVGMQWRGFLGARFAPLKEIYGDAYGGFLMGDSLRAALLCPRKVYALWNIDEFRMQPEVEHALVKKPGIHFFMDAYNLWYYGVRDGTLYVFDAETDELDSLGPVEQALETRLDEMESARREVESS
jgi:hypothetical protein